MSGCNLAYYRDRRNKRIEECKAILGGKCVLCRSEENLEFDHKDPDSVEFRIGSNPTLAWARVLEELKKCQLLCRSCHIAKSIQEGSLPESAKHGSLAMYHHHHCRCEECVLFRRQYVRDYRRRKKLHG